MKPVQILIVDMGSQYTQVIGRTLRELGYRSAILSPEKAGAWLAHTKPQAIILSGGSASVYDEGAPQPPKNILRSRVPILGICYGMQWLTQHYGGKVVPHTGKKEYGKAQLTYNDATSLFKTFPKKSIVWASHGDTVAQLPKGFEAIAHSTQTKGIAAIQSIKKKTWGVQFHPEVTHTKNGKKIIENFLAQTKCEPDWEPSDMITAIRKSVHEMVGEKKCIIGFSGGVDSTVLSAILAPVLGKSILGVCLDTGSFREEELTEIKLHAKAAGVKLKVIKAAGQFQKVLGTTTHAEIKRKRFSKLYGKILEQEAKKFGAHLVAQGTLATDLIESGKMGASALIKTHHNVGIKWELEELAPLQELFKYEVRALSYELNLPSTVSERHPFPGPGLFIRIIGAPAKTDKLSIVRWADARVREIVEKKYGKDYSQLVVGLNCTRTVGVKGDARVYGYSIIVRGIKTIDFMTAEGYQFPAGVRREISRIVTQHPKIVAVDFRETDKPPCTTELE